MTKNPIRFKRGQAALEFLMTYGWAILVVLIAIGALAYLGVLNPSKLIPEKCVLGAGLTCNGVNVEVNSITLDMTNSLGKNINLISMVVGVCQVQNDSTQSRVSAGQTFQYIAFNDTADPTGSNPCAAGAVGETFTGEIKINYEEVDTGFQKTILGDLNAVIQ